MHTLNRKSHLRKNEEIPEREYTDPEVLQQSVNLLSR